MSSCVLPAAAAGVWGGAAVFVVVSLVRLGRELRALRAERTRSADEGG